MAIARGAGTEIIRTAHFEDVVNTTTKLIVGVQHHIYTVLSLVCFCSEKSGTEKGYLRLQGYDSVGGTTNQTIQICVVDTAGDETFVWNDKFSFNGCEPANFTGPMDDATKQDAIADQDPSNGSPVSQYLAFLSDSANTKFDLVLTYIDQNNA